MSFLDRLLKTLTGGSAGSSQAGANNRWIYVQCSRCGEPLKARVNTANDLSLDEDGETYIVRKGLVGSGRRRCFQTVEATLQFSSNRRDIINREITGGQFITAEAYEALINEPPAPEEEGDEEDA